MAESLGFEGQIMGRGDAVTVGGADAERER